MITDSRGGKKRKYSIASTYRGYRGSQHPSSRYSNRARVLRAPYVSRAGASTARKVDNAMNPTQSSVEIKTADTNGAVSEVETTLSSNGSTWLLNPITVGNAFYQRIGKKFTAKNLRVRGEIIFYSDMVMIPTSIHNNAVRLVVVYIKEHTASLPDFNEIFQGISSTGSTVATMYSGLNPSRYPNVFVLRDWIVEQPPMTPFVPPTSPPGDPLASAINRVRFDEFIDCGPLSTFVRSNASPMTVDNIENGAILLFARASEASTVAWAGMNFIARYRYTDV